MNAKDLRILFMGTPEFAVASLRALVEGGYNVVAVVTAPDKPAGRGQKLHQSDVKRYASELGLKVLQPVKLRDPEFAAELEALKPDLGVVIAFRMLPESVWNLPRLGTFNLHASLLPQYRGAAPINWAIINGETETGITTFMLNHQIDTGDILGQQRTPITPDDNVGTLYDRLMEMGKGLVIETVERIAAGTAARTVQNNIPESEIRPAPKIFKEDCRIDWNMDGQRIINLIRGLSPYPTAWTPMYKGGEEATTIKVFAAHFEAARHGQPAGELSTDGRKRLAAACADGWIVLDDVQIAGKRRMSTRDLLLGFRDAADYTFAKL